MSIRTAIVEDEPLARARLRSLLEADRQIELVGEAADGESALRLLRHQRPHLVFLDVRMPGMDGFELLAALGPHETPEVVFVTAFDKFAVKAFELHALDYLLKPFDRARFEKALRHAKERLARPHPERLLIRDGAQMYFVKVAEIDWIESAGNYLKLHQGKTEHLLRETLGALEGRLDPARFIRVRRTAMVQIDAVVRMERWTHGELVLTLKNGARVTSSRTYRDRIEALLRSG